MPEVSQYTFKHQEVLEALIKKAGLHEGKWQLSLSFGLSALNMGPSPDQMVPGAAIGVLNFVLLKAQAESPESLVADAAVVNPAST
jgi:hypothetical protein